MTDNLELGHQDHLSVPIADKDVERGKLMVEARPQKTQPDDQRRLNMAQGLVKISAVLLGDEVSAILGNSLKIGLSNRVEIADHGVRAKSCCQQRSKASIGSNKRRCMLHCRTQIFGSQHASTDETDWFRFRNNRKIGDIFTHRKETRHILVAK